MHHTAAAPSPYSLTSSHYPALPSPGPSRKHTSLNRCVCVCLLVFWLQVPGDPTLQATEQGPAWVSSHIGTQKKGWKLSFTSSFPRLCSRSAWASPEPLRLTPSSLSNRKAVDTISGWGPGGREAVSSPGAQGSGGPTQVSGTQATAVRSHPRARLSWRQRARGPTHPPSAPAAGSKRDPAKMSHSHPAG